MTNSKRKPTQSETMTMNKLLSTLIAGLWAGGLSAAIVVPATTTTFAPPSGTQIVNATNWDNGEPVAGVVGLVAIDGNMNANPTGYTVVQSAGTTTYNNNRTWGNAIWYQTGGIFGTGTSNILAVDGSPHAYYAVGGELNINTFQGRFSSSLHIQDGTVTLVSLNISDSGVLRFYAGGTGTLAITRSDAIGLTTGTGTVIDFELGFAGSMTVTGFTQSNFETLWNQSRLKFDGGNAGNFADHYLVSGSTLALVPEPSTWALLAGLIALTWVLRRRRAA